MSTKENPCKNFAPNVFNKNKCLNCFKSRDTHLKSDKDLNKAKPIYGGWLLLAPIGTDFGNPAQKNRKWQRRWFILFEHGALRYSLDNNATTVAQGTIDMNKCTNVAYAETITDQKHSLCIYLPEQCYYIRGESREDIMGWNDQLEVYPETNREEMKRKQRLKKRGFETPAVTQPVEDLSKKQLNSPLLLRSRNSSSSSVRSPTSERGDLFSPRIFSKKSDVDLILSGSERSSRTDLNSPGDGSQDTSDSNKLDPSYFVTERKTEPQSKEKPDSSVERLQRNISVSTSSLDSSASNYSLADSADGSQVGNSKSKKHLKDYQNMSEITKGKRLATSHHKEQRKDQEKRNRTKSPGRDENERSYGRERKRTTDRYNFESSQPDTSNKENDEPSTTLSDQGHVDRSGSSANAVTSPVTSPLSTPRDSDREDKRGRSIARRSTNMKQGTQSEVQPRTAAELRRAKSLDRSAFDMHFTTDLFNSKKGWLQRQTSEGNWTKHWFVLAKNQLHFYPDSSSEDNSAPHGSIDFSNFVKVHECDVQRNYGFLVKTSNAVHTFSAMTSGIRRNWINAIQKACQPAEIIENEKFSSVPAVEEKPEVAEQPPSPTIPSISTDLNDSSVSERSQRRRARIRERKKEGRSRTFDFGEIRRGETDQILSNKVERPARTETKARTRTFDTSLLLKDAKKPVSSSRKSLEEEDGSRRSDLITIPDNKPSTPRSSSNIRMSIESEWKKVEKTDFLNVEPAPSPSPITKTASMVKALQSEVDSLKLQMERVQNEKHLSSDDISETDSATEGFRYPDSNSTSLQRKLDQQNNYVEKLKQELSIAQEALRKQNSDLREREMQLEISLSEAQLAETQFSKAQNELKLEKSRREEAEKEHKRKTNAFNKDLEDSESELKKAESLHLEAQRKIRELERQIHQQKDHSSEEKLLQGHIGLLKRQVEDQEIEMKEMQESFEEKCQHQKKLEDRLSEANELVKTYEDEVHELRKSLKNTDKDASVMAAHRQNAKIEMKRLSEDLQTSRRNEEKLKEQIQQLIAQSQVDEDCNKSLQDDLGVEKSTNQRLRLMLQEHEEDYIANEKQLSEATATIEQLRSRLKASEDTKVDLETKYKELGTDIKRYKEEVAKATQSEQAMRDRWTASEKQLRDIEEIGSKSSSSTSQSSFKAMASELEAEFGGMGKVIAARLQSLEPSRRVSDPSINVEKETTSHKIHRLESELEDKMKNIQASEDRLKSYENTIKELEKREQESEERFKSKLQKLQASQNSSANDHEGKTSDYEITINELESKLAAIQHCLGVLYGRVSNASDPNVSGTGRNLMKTVIGDILKLSSGDTQLSNTPPPSPNEIPPERDTSRVEDRTQQKDVNRLLELVERLKSGDGQLVSPSVDKSIHIDSQLEPALSDDAARQLFAKQIGIQALLLAEMAVTLRRTQNPPTSNSRSRAGAAPSQLSSGEFSENKLPLCAPGGLLEHVDTLAQKLTLEGVLMREISHLKESWLLNRGRSIGHRGLSSGSQSSSELNNAMVTHAHISYVLQVYNERISRLSLEAKQARHRADAAMRKLRELVQACKTQDLNTISTLAVQVDTDSIASPYSEKPQWEQQVDYGTLHGAHSVNSSSTESSHLDQEATFFQHLADDLTCMSADVQSLSKLGARLIQADSALQKCLLPSEIGEHASTVAREAIVQAEIIYISHRLRRDYDEELRKAKEAVSEQSSHFEKNLKQSEEKWATKLKQITEEHNAKVTKLMQDCEKLEKARAEMSDDMEQRLTRISKKQEQKLTTVDAKHEQEKVSLKAELTRAKSDLQTNTKEYMREIKGLKEKLKNYEIERMKEISSTKEDCSRELEASKAEYILDLKSIKEKHSAEVQELKSEFEKELGEADKEFMEKLSSIESAKKEEMEKLKEKHRSAEKALKKDHQDSLSKVERDSRSKLESLKNDFDELLKQEKLKHQMALKNARDDAETAAQSKAKTRINNLKKEHDKTLERRDILHQEQLEREKEIWMKECRKQIEAEREVSHSRASSMTSEAESKEAFKAQITSLEKQLTSVQGKLETEQHKHEYRSQLNAIKSLCEESFTQIENSHAKQLEDLTASHKRELKKLIEDHENELKSSEEDTKKVIEAMRKHHVEELRNLREEVRTGSNRNRQPDLDKLTTELETLSEHYSRKCVDLANALEEKEKIEDSLKSLERKNLLLRSRKPFSSDIELDSEVKKLSTSTKEDQEATDLYQLQVMLRVKMSEIDYLKQDITSLNKQLDEAYQENKLLHNKHKNLFDELTLSRSKEGMARREALRLKEELRQQGVFSDEDLDNEATESRRGDIGGYDFQKSRSQPDFPASGKPPLAMTSQPSSSGSSVKRRSSDRSNRYGKLR